MLKRFIYFVLAVLTLGACVMIPYYTWHSTWFGRPLSDIELTEYLQNQDNPRRIQHALTQVAERIEERGDSSFATSGAASSSHRSLGHGTRLDE